MIVIPDWVVESIKKGERLNESDYHPSLFFELEENRVLQCEVVCSEYKKASLHTDNLQKLVPVDLDQTINVDKNEDNQAQAFDEEGKSECLVCSKCLNITFYEALLTEPDFLCDECLAGDHLECEVEDCGECKQIGEMIVSRRQAEVFGRVEKLTGRNVSQM